MTLSFRVPCSTPSAQITGNKKMNKEEDIPFEQRKNRLPRPAALKGFSNNT